MSKPVNILSHIDAGGNPSMVDVSDKAITIRTANAQAVVQFPAAVFETLAQNNFLSKKGSIFHTAIIAGTMAAKNTAGLIPLCHQLFLSQINVVIEKGGNELIINATVKCEGKTGVEMEALTAASITALTVYDMCKALSHDITITGIQLLNKKGGKNDFAR